MKCLSIRQPWAWLIVQGLKDIENRNWNTSYRGFFLVHAGKQVDGTFFANDGKTIYLPYAERVCGALAAGLLPRQLEDYERGGIIGYAWLQDVVTSSDSPWFYGPYGFVLTGHHTVPFIPLHGQPGLFDVPTEIEEQINEIRDAALMQETEHPS